MISADPEVHAGLEAQTLPLAHLDVGNDVIGAVHALMIRLVARAHGRQTGDVVRTGPRSRGLALARISLDLSSLKKPPGHRFHHVNEDTVRREGRGNPEGYR